MRKRGEKKRERKGNGGGGGGGGERRERFARVGNIVHKGGRVVFWGQGAGLCRQG